MVERLRGLLFMNNSDNKQNTMVPKLRFPEFFKHNKNWKKKILKHYLKESRILGSKGNIAKKITVKLWGKGVYEKEEYIQGSPNTQYYIRKSGQFIYSKLDFLNQAFGIIPVHLNGYESTVDLPCFDISNELNNKFLLEYIQRDDFYKKFGEIADGGRVAKRIQVGTFLSFSILLPELEEQQKIADCLSSVDDLITVQEKKIDSLQKHKKGLMQQLLPIKEKNTPKLRFPNFKNDKKILTRELGSLSKITAGGTPESTNSLYWDGNVPWMNSGELNKKRIYSVSNFITELGLKESSTKLIPSHCVLIGLAGQGKTRGTAAINYISLCTNQSIAAIHPNEEKFISDFLFHQIDAMYDQLRALSKGEGGRGGLNLQIIKSVEVYLPTLKEQQKIADCLSSLDELISLEIKKLELFKIHKKGLMQQLFPSMDEVS